MVSSSHYWYHALLHPLCHLPVSCSLIIIGNSFALQSAFLQTGPRVLTSASMESNHVQARSQQAISVKGQIISILSMAGQIVSMAVTQLCRYSIKQPYLSEQSWLCPNKTLLTKTEGPALVHRLQLANSKSNGKSMNNRDRYTWFHNLTPLLTSSILLDKLPTLYAPSYIICKRGIILIIILSSQCCWWDYVQCFFQ